MQLTPHPLSLRQLQYAAAVADARSFRRAAERCRVAQPSLSAQIAQLEAGLGVRLFERDRRRVAPTHAGQEILDRARRLLVDADDLVEIARRRHDPLTRTLRIGVIPTIAPYLLPDAVRALRAAHPQLTVVWLEDKTGALVARLAEGSLDAIIAALPLSGQSGDIDYEEIAKDEFVLAAPSGHPLACAPGPARPEELRGCRRLPCLSSSPAPISRSVPSPSQCPVAIWPSPGVAARIWMRPYGVSPAPSAVPAAMRERQARRSGRHRRDPGRGRRSSADVAPRPSAEHLREECHG
jgi:DNA-binding transcriptional LysR family regulator